MKSTVNLSIIFVLASALLTMPLYSHAADVLDKIGNNISNATNDAAGQISDGAISTSVKAALLLEPDIKSFDILVNTTNGVVTLDGQVDTQLQADKIVEIAQSVSGVKDVVSSKLKVKSSDNYIKDAYITAKVKGKLLQLVTDKKIAAGNDLHVETTDGTVHIFGTVSDSTDANTIIDAVKAISGVQSVHTDIDVKK